MKVPGTNKNIVLDGVEITAIIEEVFHDFLMEHAFNNCGLDGDWLGVFPIAYPPAWDAGLIVRVDEAAGFQHPNWRFTDKGKRVFGLWLLLRESGAHAAHASP